MKLSGLHLLLTYKCTLECDHCFVWGSPWQSGTMTAAQVREILSQASEVGTIKSIYFEGGEPFLYYATLVAGVRAAAQQGFGVGIVSNAYWATSFEDAVEWLRPLAGLLVDLSVSSDEYHAEESASPLVENARAAAEFLGIPVGTISIAKPEAVNAASASGQLPRGESAVMYRGRAVEKLVGRAAHMAWDTFTVCPHEDLREPGRVHVDPFGNVHLCDGIVIGNLFQKTLRELVETFDPDGAPIVGALLVGGPTELVRRYGLAHRAKYADACHLCDDARRALRYRFPEILKPDQMYQVC